MAEKAQAARPFPVRGYIRAEGRVRATVSPTGYKQLVSEMEREANDNVTLTGSALAGRVVVTSVIDHQGGVAISVLHNGKRKALILVPELAASEAGQPIQVQGTGIELNATAAG